MLSINTKAPEFNLPDQLGKEHRLSDYLGKWVLLYFYPKDDTPGCTIEACSFRDNLPQFEKLNLQVLGVNADSVASHVDFVNKHGLNFTILSDETKKTISDYQAGGIFTKRISYLINPVGLIVKTYDRVNPETHVGEVKKDLQGLISK